MNVNHSTKPDKKKVFSFKYIFLSLGLSIGGMAAVFYYTYTPGLLAQLETKRLPGLIIAFILSILRVVLSAAKFRHLTDKELSWPATFRTLLVWDFTSAVTPSTVGGAPMGMYAMSKENISMGKATAITVYSILLEQIWFALLIPVLLLAGFYFDVVPNHVGNTGESIMILMYILLLSYGALLSYSVFRNPAMLRKIVNKIFKLHFLKRFEAGITKTTGELEESAIQLRSKPRRFVWKAFALSTFSWIARAAIPVAVILSFGPADVALSFLRSFAFNLAGLFIPTPGGSGGFEGLFALFMGTLMPRIGFLALALFLWRIISYYISIGLGAWATVWYLRK